MDEGVREDPTRGRAERVRVDGGTTPRRFEPSRTRRHGVVTGEPELAKRVIAAMRAKCAPRRRETGRQSQSQSRRQGEEPRDVEEGEPTAAREGKRSRAFRREVKAKAKATAKRRRRRAARGWGENAAGRSRISGGGEGRAREATRGGGNVGRRRGRAGGGRGLRRRREEIHSIYSYTHALCFRVLLRVIYRRQISSGRSSRKSLLPSQREAHHGGHLRVVLRAPRVVFQRFARPPPARLPPASASASSSSPPSSLAALRPVP